jgi:hypothetical protein
MANHEKMMLRCRGCDREVEDLAEHFRTSADCESKAYEMSRRELAASEERMSIEEPERYAALQRLKGLTPVSGTDPDFDYAAGRPKS